MNSVSPSTVPRMKALKRSKDMEAIRFGTESFGGRAVVAHSSRCRNGKNSLDTVASALLMGSLANKWRAHTDSPHRQVLMLTLFHHPFCPHSRFIRLAVAEHGVEVRLVEERPW